MTLCNLVSINQSINLFAHNQHKMTIKQVREQDVQGSIRALTVASKKRNVHDRLHKRRI